MRPVIWLTALGAVLVLGFMAWVVASSGGMGGAWTGGSPHILAAMVIGVAGAGALTAGLMWLAFYSARKGYDERADHRDGDF